MYKKQFYLTIFLVILFSFFFQVTITKALGVVINNESSFTKNRLVTLALSPPANPVEMIVSNSLDFANVSWEPYQLHKLWYLSYGRGSKTVFVKYKDNLGRITDVFSDTILFDIQNKMSVDFKINNGVAQTTSREVNLTTFASEGVESYRVSNSKDFSYSQVIAINSGIIWYLTPGSGAKTVYVEFKDGNGKTVLVSKKITYTQAEHFLGEGTLLKAQTGTLYYFGFDGKIHPFTSLTTYNSWYNDFSKITYVSNAKLKPYATGRPVCLRPGYWIVKFKGFPKMYAVEPGCILRPLMSKVEAYILFGADWQKRLLELGSSDESAYDVRDIFSLPVGSIDQDRDGLTQQVEIDNGTNDTSADTDGDGLSDYEEINYWYSDPTNPDSNGNGVNDGAEVMKNSLPIGQGKFTSVANGTYDYPKGYVIKRTDNNYFYHRLDGRYCALGKSYNPLLSNTNFKSNFIINQEIAVPFTVSSNCSLSAYQWEIQYPTLSNYGVVDKM